MTRFRTITLDDINKARRSVLRRSFTRSALLNGGGADVVEGLARLAALVRGYRAEQLRIGLDGSVTRHAIVAEPRGGCDDCERSNGPGAVCRCGGE